MMFHNFIRCIACQTKGFQIPKVFDLSTNSAQLYLPFIFSERKFNSARAQKVRCPEQPPKEPPPCPTSFSIIQMA